MYDQHDYIIIGAGSAGCVLANRLSVDPRNRVLLIEAGPDEHGRDVSMPMGFLKLLADSRLAWHFPAERSAGEQRDGQAQRVWVRGKALGGSSAVNAMIYCRGQSEDYDAWSAAGAEGWGWTDIERCFEQMEASSGGPDSSDQSVRLPVCLQSHRSAFSEAILRTGVELGLPRKTEVNREGNEGIGYTPVTMLRGRRVSAADAFLRPVMSRPNLQILTDALVHKVIFDGRRASGIECANKGNLREFYAAKEVIASAGAILSPKLLQLSGVGPASHLRSLGIPVIADSPGVGANLREHKVVTLQVRLRNPHSLNREFRGLRRYKNLLRYALLQNGPFASSCDILAFVKTESGLDRPDAQLTFWSLSFARGQGTWGPERQPGASIAAYPLRPQSQGSVMVQATDPSIAPRLQEGFLSSDYDRKVTIGAFRWMRRFVAHPECASFVVGETHPGEGTQSDDEILAVAKQDGICSHATGTCSFGTDRQGVVDHRFRVRGVSGLRVVDASVLPTQVSGNPNGAVMAVAFRAAELILG